MAKSERDKLIDKLEREPEKRKCAKCATPVSSSTPGAFILCQECYEKCSMKWRIEGFKFNFIEDPNYCGLGAVNSGPWDPYWQSTCKPHDEAYDEMKRTGNEKVGLLGTSARWVENTSKVFIRSLWGVIGFPFYLIGGLVGGAVRWKQIFPKETIKRDEDPGDMH